MGCSEERGLVMKLVWRQCSFQYDPGNTPAPLSRTAASGERWKKSPLIKSQ